MNIAIGKFGRSILFDKEKWTSPLGGDSEAPKYFEAIAKLNPDWKFYLVGKSDFNNLSNKIKFQLFPNNNIINLWNNIPNEINKSEYQKYITKVSSNIKFDLGIFFAGPSGNVNLYDKIKIIQKNKEGEIAKVLDMFYYYCGPIINFLNETNIKWISIVPDPRYHPIRARDLFNREKIALSQFTDLNFGNVKFIKNYEEQNILLNKSIPTIYAGLEHAFLYEYSEPEIFDVNKANYVFKIISNEGNNTGGLPKGPFIEEYILNNEYLKEIINIDNVSIYGKWSNYWYKKYPNNFKGTLKFKNLGEHISNSRYMFMTPPRDGFSTAKFWECIYYGCIPLLHKYYDSQRNLKCPEFIRILDKKDLVEKISKLEKDKQFRINLMNDLRNMIKPSFFNGLDINNTLRFYISKMLKINLEILDENYLNKINDINKKYNKSFINLIKENNV